MNNRCRWRLLLVLASVLSFAVAHVTQAQQASDDSSGSNSSQVRCGTPALIIGAVRNPGYFELRRHVRLAELITLAGGTTESARQIISISHALPAIVCDRPTMAYLHRGPAFEIHGLAEVLRGNEMVNLTVQPGDIVNVPTFEQIYVVGEVVSPQAITFKKSITVTQVIAMAGGVSPSGGVERIRIHRQNYQQTRMLIVADLKAIAKRRAEDLLLQPYDIVEVLSKESSKRRKKECPKPLCYEVEPLPPPKYLPLRVIL